ncbi:efflux RND transporter periplasmic adaptor subunit [Erythrobacter ani]|uniref:HlyD family efflux transporter periplasmic adaptor subunit n=1 Tax=Erythrobacter ani TaxID=2827235 RepID=A0ABS6SLJ7_9SPHN|nr:HlyD family efflux transporter periplasmic adaptor subunit [Erythrobacter ani]MBV7265918.1 HlyD family efflux transporter periplasmic adaptor subunit [Erythrobacter ani]
MAAPLPEPTKTRPQLSGVATGGSSGDAKMLAVLLQFEADIRRQSTVAELQYFVANEARAILPYGQMFVLRQATIGKGYTTKCVSSLATVDPNAPLIDALEKAVSNLADKFTLAKPREFDAQRSRPDEALSDYPYTQMYWQPLLDAEGSPFAGLLLAREETLRNGEKIRIARIGDTTAHSWLALTGKKPVRRLPVLDSRKKKWIAIAIAVVLLFPVRLTALAPAEIVAERPYVVAAPFSGRIASVEVTPNAPVTEGQVLLRFDDIRLTNELELAKERLAVARSRLERSTSSAFAERDETSDIAIMQAEVEVAQAEFDYARQLAIQSTITAPREGMALFSDRRDWEGRAVNVGDPIMQVVNPAEVMIRIDLPSAEQMSLERGAKVKMWLDSQPLWAIDGLLEAASYQARQTPDGTLAFALTAKIDGANPRIGSRGTAQVYGQWVPFVYSLLRRPISALRQFVGI